MNDLELTSKTHCAVCADTLAVWEESICILCETDEELGGEQNVLLQLTSPTSIHCSILITCITT